MDLSASQSRSFARLCLPLKWAELETWTRITRKGADPVLGLASSVGEMDQQYIKASERKKGEKDS